MPGFSQTLNPMTNVWGQDVFLQGGLGPDIISPYYHYAEEDRPIDEWLYDNKIHVDMPAKRLFDVELTDDEYYRYKKLQGNETKDPATGLGLYDTLNAIIELKHPVSGAWLMGTNGEDGSRQMLVRQQVKYFRELARNELLLSDGVFQGKVQAREIQKLNALIPNGENQ